TLAQAVEWHHVINSPLPVSGRASRDTAADYDPGPGGRRPRDDLLMLALERRIRDLECVEHAHLNLFNKIGQSPGHANKAHLTLLLQRQGRLQCTIFLELPPREASVKLDQVEIVRLHSPQALLQAGADVFG